MLKLMGYDSGLDDDYLVLEGDEEEISEYLQNVRAGLTVQEWNEYREETFVEDEDLNVHEVDEYL